MKQKLILLTVLLTALSAFSAEYYVDASRPDDSGVATNWATAKQTIQAAVDLAADEDTVWVTNGVYATGGVVAPVYQDMYFLGIEWVNSLTNRVCVSANVTVRSVNGPAVTIIQGASDNGTPGPAAVRCAYLLSGAVMEGFTLTSGYTSGAGGTGEFLDQIGGGVLLLTNSLLNNCILSGNSAIGQGGGAACYQGGILNNCVINRNIAYQGGGVFCEMGGILNNCTVSQNTANYGGGVDMLNDSSINNCIVWGNTAGIVGDNINMQGGCIHYTCSSPLPEGEGNICADPMFKNPLSNFRLRVGSPCVDAGSNVYAPATDLDGVARPVDGDNNGSAIADMGCYELNAASLPKTYYVDASRPDDSGAATNWATAKQTIQAAVDLATDEDTVWVTNGVYSTGGMVAPTYTQWWGSVIVNTQSNRVCITKAITVQSANGPVVTVIRGGGTARCAYLMSGAVMEGFTLMDGHAFASGDIDWVYRDGEWVSEDRRYNRCGGGAYLVTNAVLNRCILSGNYADDGGGVFCNGGGALNNCLLNGNTAIEGGGAALVYGVLNNCTVSGNSVHDNDSRIGAGGGVVLAGGVLNNSTIWGNTHSSSEDNIYKYSGVIGYICSSPLPEGEGNICADPMFVDATNNNFQLQISSPCINAGNNSYVSTATDLAGNSRIVAGVVDMGAYEFTGLPGDFDCDGLSDEWEVRYFGNINRAVATAICSNGFNTIREAYIAGLDPNDAAAFFEMDGNRTAEKSVLWWNATSGRVYSVYFSTNLMSGFQPLETNIPWTAGAFTDSVHNAQRQLFYKVDVQLVP